MLAKGEVGDLNKKQKEYIKKIQGSTERMIQLINDLLEVSRIKSDAFEINYQATDFSKIIKEVIGDVKLVSESKKCSIIYKKTKTKIPEIQTDPHLLHQIIYNILDNSILYSREIGCKIILKTSFGKNHVNLSVKDNGIGIPEDFKKDIFKRFFRAENAIMAFANGTGLGLHVAKSTLEMLKGDIWFESEEGKGTTFYIKIPINPKRTQKY